MGTMSLELVRPERAHLASYQAALQRGWSPDNVRLDVAIAEELGKITTDADGFLAALDDPAARGGAITLPDGSVVPRLPGFRRWLWDGEICGSFGFRWQPPGPDLPPWVLGHIGYAVVPWKRRLGYATRGLGLLLDLVRPLGLPYVDLTTDPDNQPSQRVITANGGVLVERFRKEAYDGTEGLRFRIAL
jgi:predicted acetyltransferase